MYEFDSGGRNGNVYRYVLVAVSENIGLRSLNFCRSFIFGTECAWLHFFTCGFVIRLLFLAFGLILDIVFVIVVGDRFLSFIWGCLLADEIRRGAGVCWVCLCGILKWKLEIFADLLLLQRTLDHAYFLKFHIKFSKKIRLFLLRRVRVIVDFLCYGWHRTLIFFYFAVMNRLVLKSSF